MIFFIISIVFFFIMIIDMNLLISEYKFKIFKFLNNDLHYTFWLALMIGATMMVLTSIVCLLIIGR